MVQEIRLDKYVQADIQKVSIEQKNNNLKMICGIFLLKTQKNVRMILLYPDSQRQA